MPKTVESEEIHFVHGLLGGPIFVSHAVGGHEYSGAVVAKSAMYKNFFLLVAKEREKLRNLFVAWRSPAADRNIYETNSQGFRLLALTIAELRIFAAQINDGGDAEFFQLLQAVGVGLRTAIKIAGDATTVRESWQF